MIDIFVDNKLDLTNLTCHSGGAVGADTFFETIGSKYGVKTKAYSYKTKNHTSENKVEISDSDFNEGITEINKANKHLGRFGIHKYMNLLARNWCQVKYSKQIFAIGTIINPGKKSIKGYYSKSKIQTLNGGTAYAVMIGINNLKEIFVYDQNQMKWFKWSYDSMSFIETTIPKITSQDFAGIGTREINSFGVQAIEDVYKQTFLNF